MKILFHLKLSPFSNQNIFVLYEELFFFPMSYSWHLFSWLLFFWCPEKMIWYFPFSSSFSPLDVLSNICRHFYRHPLHFPSCFIYPFYRAKLLYPMSVRQTGAYSEIRLGGEFRIWGRKKLLGGRSFPFPVYFPIIRKQVKFCFCLPIGLNKIVYIILFSFFHCF